MKKQVLSNINNKTNQDSKKNNFIKRLKSSIFIIIYFLIITIFSFFCNPQYQFISAFSSNKWYPFIFYLGAFFSTIWLNFFIVKEINNCFIQYKKLKNDLILFFLLMFFELSTIWILPFISYELIDIDNVLLQIIFVSCLGGSIFFITIFGIIYFKFNGIHTTKNRLLGVLIIVLVYLTFVAGNYLITTKSWFNLLILALIPAINDTFAYFGGIIFGKHKMSPYLSPKKTWEGFFIGIIATFCVSIAIFFLLYFINNPHTNMNYCLLGSFVGWQWLNTNSVSVLLENTTHWYWLIILCIICAMVAIVSVYGDLLFSYFKRVNQIKDYSNFIPGHGGVLDRIDSFALAIVSYFILSIIINLCFNGFSSSSFLISQFIFT